MNPFHGVAPPVTPPPRSSSLTNDTAVVQLLTPENQMKLTSLKRKASQLSDQPSPREAVPFLKYRLAWLRDEIEVRDHTRTSLPATAVREQQTIRTEQDELEQEEAFLLKQFQFTSEDLQDSVETAEDAYLDDLYRSFRGASEIGQRQFAKAKTALSQKQFSPLIEDYLNVVRYEGQGKNAEKKRHCAILGQWFNTEYTRIAHIVPKSFDSKGLEYLFGIGDSALSSDRNGLCLHASLEKAFDNGWIAIVPFENVGSTPTEWKVLLLNRDKANQTACLDANDQRLRWRDLDGRKLTFLNNNRPARRYLYFRYTMAIMQAQSESNPVLDTVPKGTIWASPGKEDGYLRRSTLRSLARKVGDRDLPDELLEAGTFEDTQPESSASPVLERVSVLEVALTVRNKISGKGKEVEREDDSENDEE